MADLLHEVQGLAARHGILDDTQKFASISAAEYLAKKELCNRYYTLLLEDDATQSTESNISPLKSVQNGIREHLAPHKIPLAVHYLKKGCY